MGMKSTGVVRKIDELGRITLPIEIRRIMDIEQKDPIEIFVENNSIILKKYEATCIFCGNNKGNALFNEKYVCKICRDALKKIKN